MEIINESWLKLTPEEPIDPGLPICDAHHHLWDHVNPNDLRPGRYVLDELLRDTGSGHRIIQTVFMECTSMYRKDGPPAMRPLGETEFVNGIAAQSASGQYGPTRAATGIVGFADLTLGASVDPVLEEHVAAARDRFRGVRYISTWHAEAASMGRVNYPKGLLLDSKFREGFSYLQKYGLSFDSWLYFTQLTELADLARAFPRTPVIVNHIGGLLGVGPYAGKRDDVFNEWKLGMTVLASCPNVMVKLGGLGMVMCGFRWHERPVPPDSIELAGAMAPYFQTCIELFGVDRCMFESNFPVDKLSFSYNVMWNAFKRIAKGFTAKERSALFYDTAVRVYRLPAAFRE
jgi:L-fuconolactonase